MASVSSYLLADGSKRWRVRYRTPDRRQTDRRGFRTKREAMAFMASVEVSKLRGEYIEHSAGQVSIGQLGPAWLQRQVHLKASSARVLQISWRVHVEPHWGAVPIYDVKFSDAQQWVSELAILRGATIVIRAFGVLRAVLDDAVRDRRLASNPVAGVTLPRKVTGEHTYLTHQQLWALADAAGKHGPLVLTLGYTGIRWSEASGLRVMDVDLHNHRLNISQNAVKVGTKFVVGTPKSHRSRIVPFPALITAQLQEQCTGKDPTDLVFVAPLGGFLKPPNGTRGWFERARIIAGLPRLTPHDLRHTAAALMISAGASVKSVQQALGHRSASLTLDVYGWLLESDTAALGTALDAAARAARPPE